MFDQNAQELSPAENVPQSFAESVAHEDVATPDLPSESAVSVPVEEPAHVNGTDSRRHSEAGRKGAQRLHQLIEEGRLYEKEHGLKSGRQRLRQLLELGKRYEQEHGLGGSRRQPKDALDRMDADQLLKVLFRTLLRLSKPAYRGRLVDVLQKLGDVTP